MRNKREMKDSIPQLTMRIGKTTYVVGINFNEDTKETIDDKIRKMIREDVKKMEESYTN